jgi:CRISPR locus-related DNA-binding protein
MNTVQIALVGNTADPIKTGVREKNCQKIYLLPSKETLNVARQIEKDLAGAGYTNIIIEQIDAFDLNSIVNSILKINDNEKNSEICINITGGTNLMAGAATSAAYFIGAKAFYVLYNREKKETKIYDLPIPKLPYFNNLAKKKIEILKKILKKGNKLTQAEIAREVGITPQAASKHIKVLEKMRFIFVKREKKDHEVSLTNEGRLAVEWNL